MRIAFLYIAEAYQCYHGAAVAIVLAARPGWEVVSYYNDPRTPHHLERVRAAWGAPPMDYRRLDRSPATRALQGVRKLGLLKERVLRDNAAELDGYDAVFTVEDTVAPLARLGAPHPKLLYAPHGAGDRARGFVPQIRDFDYVLLAGEKLAARMLAGGMIRPGDYAVTGSVKMETIGKLGTAMGPLFANDAAVVLYNAHKEPRLGSWRRFIEPMLAGFAADPAMNLIVAPHVKMFHRASEATRARWRARSGGNVLVDPGSDRSVDGSYARVADIYVGDVSSQVYEFLARPRPCVFLNAHGIEWQGDPSFAHWRLGDVIDDPAELMDAIRAAPGRHHLYRARQEAMAAASLGDFGRDTSPGAAERAAAAVAAFLARDHRAR